MVKEELMLFDTNKLFTIGQFARLHEINKKTLMWYDEIGLLKPAVIKENGYRYYSFQQSSLLETILMLRELKVSICEIQEFLNDCSPLSLEKLLDGKLAEVDGMISHLKAIRSIMDKKKQSLAAIRTLDLSAISIIEKKEAHYYATVATSPDTPLEEEIERIIAETKKYQLHRLHDASYGAMLSVENVYNGRFNDYCELYIELPFPTHKQGLHIQPKGTYLRAFCKGRWERLSGRYKEILEYAREHELQMFGFAYEKGINEPVIDTLDEYITQIEIPVRRK